MSYTEIIGKILPTYGDRWSNNIKYEVNTIVYYDELKASFISKQASYNQAPAITSDYWQLISKDGTNGKYADYSGIATQSYYSLTASYSLYSDTASYSTKALEDGNGNTIATTYLPLSGKATINGGLQTTLDNSQTYIYDNVASKYLGADNKTGTILIDLPNNYTNSMNIYEIELYEHNSDTQHHTKITVSGYNCDDNTWKDTSTTIEGGDINKSVRLGYNSKTSKCCILIGTTTSTWDYTSVYLTKILSHYYNSNSWRTGYNISLITDESNITKIVTPPISPKIAGGFIIPGGTSNQLLTADGGSISTSSLIIATASTANLGTIKVGNNLSITNDGTLSANNPSWSQVQGRPTTLSELTNDVGFITNDYVNSTTVNYNNGWNTSGTTNSNILDMFATYSNYANYIFNINNFSTDFVFNATKIINDCKIGFRYEFWIYLMNNTAIDTLSTLTIIDSRSNVKHNIIPQSDQEDDVHIHISVIKIDVNRILCDTRIATI